VGRATRSAVLSFIGELAKGCEMVPSDKAVMLVLVAARRAGIISSGGAAEARRF